ncbi:MAG: 50S ribosomal protein L14e [Candidatus Bathyarchaeia archaeon]
MTTSAVEVGRVCLKLRGREAGRRCVIVDVIDRNYVLVTGPQDLTGVRRRRVNISHLEPLDERIEIGRDATNDEVREALRRK